MSPRPVLFYLALAQIKRCESPNVGQRLHDVAAGGRPSLAVQDASVFSGPGLERMPCKSFGRALRGLGSTRLNLALIAQLVKGKVRAAAFDAVNGKDEPAILKLEAASC